MCILFVAINQHPDYSLIVCANRDEFYQRPTQAMHWWHNFSFFAGKDLQAGGTWFGVNAQKKFAALTNYRLPNKFDNTKKSRGDLVINALTSNPLIPELFMPDSLSKHINCFPSELQKTSYQYNHFNLLSGDETNLQCFDSTTRQFTRLTNGTFSLCNGALNNIWPKMRRGRERLKELVRTHTEVDIEQLFILMQDNTQAAANQLPNTGISSDWEQLLSSIFIISPEYGTRSTTLFLKDKQGNCKIIERSYDRCGTTIKQVEFSL